MRKAALWEAFLFAASVTYLHPVAPEKAKVVPFAP